MSSQFQVVVENMDAPESVAIAVAKVVSGNATVREVHKGVFLSYSGAQTFSVSFSNGRKALYLLLKEGLKEGLVKELGAPDWAHSFTVGEEGVVGIGSVSPDEFF